MKKKWNQPRILKIQKNNELKLSGDFEDILYHKGEGVAKGRLTAPIKETLFAPKPLVKCMKHFSMPGKTQRLE